MDGTYGSFLSCVRGKLAYSDGEEANERYILAGWQSIGVIPEHRPRRGRPASAGHGPSAGASGSECPTWTFGNDLVTLELGPGRGA
jgi:hypothetical protein